MGLGLESLVQLGLEPLVGLGLLVGYYGYGEGARTTASVHARSVATLHSPSTASTHT